ncbi:MAG: diphthamide biosynthesis enzyme Dph2 [Nanoarchaeota archaeon]|nr:diphthamide biosynthesis enzyme Dph2 [Nanoarchaeota archaeon]MBU4124539.1 diphthamide biosynthesis enzyme Dph2 [Nanoarchaeota archaeon]
MKFLQIPDGLKTKALEIADELGDVVISCESCYGSCDIREDEAKLLGCDEIVHYGHSKMIDSDIKVEYVEKRESYDPTEALGKLNIKFNKIGLISAVQFLDSLDIAKKVLGNRAILGGQVLGCDVSNAEKIVDKVDCFLFIGSGKFHAIGVALKTGKPVFILNVEHNRIEEVDVRLFEKQRIAAQVISRDAKVWGILVSTKLGQMNIKLAKQVRDKLKPKKSYILSMDEIRPEKLEGIKVDAYVNTACPRIAIENRTDFGKPILNPDEI